MELTWSKKFVMFCSILTSKCHRLANQLLQGAT